MRPGKSNRTFAKRVVDQLNAATGENPEEFTKAVESLPPGNNYLQLVYRSKIKQLKQGDRLGGSEADSAAEADDSKAAAVADPHGGAAASSSTGSAIEVGRRRDTKLSL